MKLIIFSCGLLFLGAFQHFSAGAPTEDLVASALGVELPSESNIDKRDITAVQAAVENENDQGESLVDAGDEALRETRGLKYRPPVRPDYSNNGGYSNHYKPAVLKVKKYRPVVRRSSNRPKKINYKNKLVFNKVRKYNIKCCSSTRYNVSRGRGKGSRGSRRKGSKIYRRGSRKSRKSNRRRSKGSRRKSGKSRKHSKKRSRHSKKSKKKSKKRSKKSRKSRGSRGSRRPRPRPRPPIPVPVYSTSVQEYDQIQSEVTYEGPQTVLYEAPVYQENAQQYVGPPDYHPDPYGQQQTDDMSTEMGQVENQEYAVHDYDDPYQTGYHNAPRAVDVGNAVSSENANKEASSQSSTEKLTDIPSHSQSALANDAVKPLLPPNTEPHTEKLTASAIETKQVEVVPPFLITP